jgi:Flp pilus assembly protein TadG
MSGNPRRRPRTLARPDGSRGQATVELALLLPVLLLCCLGMLDFGRGLNAWVVMQNAAREGAFFAAQHSGDSAAVLSGEVDTVVLAEADPLLTAASVGNVVINGPVNVDGTLIEKTDSVTVTYVFRPATPLFSGGGITFIASASAPEGP